MSNSYSRSSSDGQDGIDRPGHTDLDSVFGPRASTLSAFSEALDLHTDADQSDLARLFRCSGGRVRLAQAIIDGAERAGVRASGTDTAQIGTLLPAELTPRITTGSGPFGVLYLLVLFSTVPRITSTAVELVHSAYRAAELEGVAETSESLAARLVKAGLLVVDVGGDRQFSVPSLIRVMANRAAAQWSPELGRSPREALDIAIADRYGRMMADDDAGVHTIIDLVVAIESWELLERHWKRRSLNAFADYRAVEAYLRVPESVLVRRPILALARSAARRVVSMSRRLDTDDCVRLLPGTDFASIIIPGLRGRALSNRAEGRTAEPAALSPDEDAAITTVEAREHRLSADFSAALRMIEAGKQRLRERDGNDLFGTTQMLQAELDLEAGRSLIFAGRFAEAMTMLERVIRFSAIYAPNSWHPVLAALVETSIASLGRGFGGEIDRNLRAARRRAHSVGLDILPDAHKALCIDFVRRLDELDPGGARQASARLRENGSTVGLGLLPLALEALQKVYEGHASIAGKMLIARSTLLYGPTEGAVQQRFSGMIDIVSFVLFAAGETKAIQELSAGMSRSDSGLALIRARQSFVFSQREQLWAHTGQVLAGGASPRLKGSASALRAAFLVQAGTDTEIHDAFGHVLDYCTIASSLLPIAQLPRQSRVALIAASSAHPGWVALADTFSDSTVTAEVLMQRLRDLPETMTVTGERGVELSSAQLSLLFAIDSPKSLAQIAKDFGVVIGTLKNRLSALYKQLGVRSRAQAVDYGHRNGYLSAADTPSDRVS